MSIGPVHWGSYSGETLEKLMAVLVAQSDPETIRRTPSSGDGGVDLLTPTETGWHVRQVKGFTGRMTNGRRRQVQASLAAVREDPRLDKPIARWSLTVPIDPTSGEQAWFEENTQDLPFPCTWEGEVHWNRLAADNPHVIDYYLRDGRERVEARARAIVAARLDPGSPLVAVDTATRIKELCDTLNRDDPHYRYEFSTLSIELDEMPLPLGAVLVTSHETTGEGTITVVVVPRHVYALEDAPISVTASIVIQDLDTSVDLATDVEAFEVFGLPLNLPPGTLNAEITAPGGLGIKVEGAAGSITTTPVGRPMERSRLALVHPHDGVVEEVLLTADHVSKGRLGGLVYEATDKTGRLRFRMKARPSPGALGQAEFDIQVGNLSGIAVGDALPIVRLVAGIRPPLEFQWRQEHGTRLLATFAPPEGSRPLDLAIATFIENVALIQEHTQDPIILPIELDDSTPHHVAYVAQVLRKGQGTRTWSQQFLPITDSVSRHDIETALSDTGKVSIPSTLTLTLGSNVHDVAKTTVRITAQIAPDQPRDDAVKGDCCRFR